MQSYQGQCVIITGAASGIGYQFALEFARRGASVGAIDRNEGQLKALSESLSIQSTASTCAIATADVTDRQAIQAAIESLIISLGKPNVVIASAGIGDENPVTNFSAETFARQVSINLIGVANTLEPLIPHFMQQRKGHIIALSSLASYRGLPNMAGYCASKAGLSAFMDSLRVELKDYGITCTTFCPGFIHTNMTSDLDLPPSEVMSLDYAIGRMMQAIDDKQSYLAFPRKNHWLLAFGRMLPTQVGDFLTMRRMSKLKVTKKDAPS